MQDVRQTFQFAKYMQAIGWNIETLSTGEIAYIRPIPLTPLSVLKIQRAGGENLEPEEVIDLMSRYKTMMSYVELDASPYKKFQEKWERVGFKPTKNGMLPTKTVIVNTGLTTKELSQRLHKKTRYNLRLAERYKLSTVMTLGDELTQNKKLFQNFVNLMQLNAKRGKYWGISKDWLWQQLMSFGNKSFIVTVYGPHDNLLAGALYLMSKDTVFYESNGATDEGRKKMASTLTVWQGILEAKKRGKKWFDFDGIYDERYPIKRWQGFSRFKKSFGGEIISYPPAYKKWWWLTNHKKSFRF
jgi:lipid II:glycine glycyltransferase (peptidoglycan interpeptide bridge formation enzyme)